MKGAVFLLFVAFCAYVAVSECAVLQQQGESSLQEELLVAEQRDVALHSRARRSLLDLFDITKLFGLLIEVIPDVVFAVFSLSISNYYGLIVYLGSAIIALVKFLFA